MKRLTLFAASLMLVAASAFAQDFQTGYFLGGYQYGYRMNPAFQSEHAFFSVGLGQIGANIQSDFGISDVFTNGISWADLQKGLNNTPDANGHKLNYLSNTEELHIISSGKWKKEKVSFSTFDLTLKSNTKFALPTDFFRYLNDGTTTSSTFDFGGLGLSNREYLEFAFGTARNFGNKFAFGFRFKALLGVANLSATMDQLDVTMGSTWDYTAKGSLSASIPFVELLTDDSGKYLINKGFDDKSVKIDATKLTKNLGLGAAIDGGVSMYLAPWFTISASILDFGFVNWQDEILGVSNASGSITPSADNPSELGSFVESFAKIAEFTKKEPAADVKTLGGKWEQMPYRVNAGVELRLPFYQRLSVGALYHINNLSSGDFQFNAQDIRLSLNWTPLNFISLSGSTIIADNFNVLGAAINLHPRIFNFFVGIDAVPLSSKDWVKVGKKLAPDADKSVQDMIIIPKGDLNINLYTGLSFAFGRRQVDYRKLSKKIIKDNKDKEEAKALEKELKAKEKAEKAEAKEQAKAEKEAAKQAELEAKEAERQAKEEAKAAKAKEKADKEAAKQAEKDAKAAAIQAEKDAKAAADKAAADAKEAERIAAEQAKAKQFEEEKARIEAAARKAAEEAAAAEAKAAEEAAAKAAAEEAAEAEAKAAEEAAAKAAEEAAAKAAAEEAARKAAEEAAAEAQKSNSAQQLLESLL